MKKYSKPNEKFTAIDPSTVESIVAMSHDLCSITFKSGAHQRVDTAIAIRVYEDMVTKSSKTNKTESWRSSPPENSRKTEVEAFQIPGRNDPEMFSHVPPGFSPQEFSPFGKPPPGAFH